MKTVEPIRTSETPGSQPSHCASTSTSSVPVTNSGSEISASEIPVTAWSTTLPARIAESTPNTIERGTSSRIVQSASTAVFRIRSPIRPEIGVGCPLTAWPATEEPRSPCTKPESQLQ